MAKLMKLNDPDLFLAARTPSSVVVRMPPFAPMHHVIPCIVRATGRILRRVCCIVKRMANRVVSIACFCLIWALGGLHLAGCDQNSDGVLQGYAEGEFVYVASPLGGALEELAVDRGQQVQAGDLLFVLESGAERAQLQQADRRLAEARATLEDLRKGLRPTEIEAMEAELQQALASLDFSQKDFERLDRLSRAGSASTYEADRARSQRDQDVQRVARLKAELATAKLGSRADRIAAADAEVRAQEAALARSQWDLSQKRQLAPAAGSVFDTYYRIGEWVPAGRPVVSLLPPENIKVRAFVPEPQIGAVKLNDRAEIRLDGVPQVLVGTVSFISPKAEFTPPVIYSRETRDKLVFMIEIVVDATAAARLHPGQPVDVRLIPQGPSDAQ